jgi:hypothetical protein
MKGIGAADKAIAWGCEIFVPGAAVGAKSWAAVAGGHVEAVVHTRLPH